MTATQGEVLLDDTTRLAERAEKAGVDVTLRMVDDSVHVYTIFPFLPETISTMAEVATGRSVGCAATTRGTRPRNDAAGPFDQASFSL